ncbi:MAG: histone deacetylase family protein, partial [Rhodospirillaceae bacterium]|nr:histone deacetylase family protein [Rhodospirillaceae bacterium]
MSTLLFSHAACLDHDPGYGHPERPERLKAVLAALAAPEFAALERREAPMADPGLLTLGHPPDFVDRILGMIPPMGRAMIDGDTIVSPGSREAALRAAGAALAAIDAVMAGEAKNAFCAVRPPGHHAEPEQAMGFCLFNNVALAGLHARANHGLRRIAVV